MNEALFMKNKAKNQQVLIVKLRQQEITIVKQEMIS